jgi:four helix bundle protein
MGRKIGSHTQLRVYRKAFEGAMRLFESSKAFPQEEKYALTDPLRRASRSVCANLAEAWHKRRYEAAFVGKLSDAEGEAAETQVWIEFAVKCNYLQRDDVIGIYPTGDEILRMLVTLINEPHRWLVK